MRIAYTFDIFSLQRHGGVSRYFSEIIRHLRNSPHELKIFGGFHCNDHIRGFQEFCGFYIPKLKFTGPLRRQVNRVLQQSFLLKQAPDVIHETYYSYSQYPKEAKLVVTVHDMIDELYPEFFPPNNPSTQVKRFACARASQIIAVSEATKSDLIRLFQIEPGKIRVIHHGTSSPSLSADVSGIEREGEFLLYVGARAGYKNFRRLLESFSSAGGIAPLVGLVCFGSSFTSEERACITRLGLDGRVRRVTGDDVVLAQYYRKARAFVYPSLCEGFGLPLLEAMAHGCPVICSDTRSFREVAGDAAAFFNPADVAQIRAALESTVNDPRLLGQLRERGYARQRQFSWDKCARETAEVYAAALR
jgi:glycosyltransferase involved in cell wall biosynthesis